MSSMLFIGSQEDLSAKVRQENKEKGIVDNTNQDKQVKCSSHKLIPPVSQDIKDILKRTIIPNDLSVVHVKRNIETYDKFYHISADDRIDADLYASARKIKRIYKSYPEYLSAVQVYNNYINALIEKYGSKQNLRVRLCYGGLDDWMPPTPIYSINSPDYTMATAGILTVPIFDDPDQEFNEDMLDNLLDSSINAEDNDYEELEIVADVETDLFVYKEFCEDAGGYSRDSSSSNTGRVNVSDLVELQKMFRANATGETFNPDKDSNHTNYLSKDPEKMRERYYSQKLLKLNPGDYAKIAEGIDLDEKDDPNMMVRDSVSRKYMPLHELQTREVIRMMGKNGWNEVKLLQRLNVGSKYEIESLKKKNKNKRRNKKLATDTINGLLSGTNIEVMSSTRDMEEFLFRDR